MLCNGSEAPEPPAPQVQGGRRAAPEEPHGRGQPKESSKPHRLQSQGQGERVPAGSRKEEGRSQPRMTELTRDAAGRRARRASGPGTAEEEGGGRRARRASGPGAAAEEEEEGGAGREPKRVPTRSLSTRHHQRSSHSQSPPSRPRRLKLLRAFSLQDRLDKHREKRLSRGQASGSMADSSMKQGQMSPSFPTTPDKNMSHIGTPDPSVSNSYNKHSKRESYKAQKRTYRSQKKEAAKELLSTITDPAVVLLGDWLKVRGTLKSWSKLWCVLKPGVLVLYKSDKHKGSQWVGTILLNTCQLLERPSKKDGFCFKLFHPLDQSIWATKGPKGETIGAFVQPLPYSYCIFRAPSESAGKCWMDALELALKCTNLLKRSMTRLDNTIDAPIDLELDRSRAQESAWQPPSHYEEYHGSQNGSDHLHDGETDLLGHSFNSMRAQERNMNDSDLERHFANQESIPETEASERASTCDRSLGKLSTDELSYALMTLKLKKMRAERQKIELEKTNLKMDILVKEERLDQEYGKDRWRKQLHPEPTDLAMTVCHPHCKSACHDSLFCNTGDCDPQTCNQSQNKQDSQVSLPQVRIHTAPARLSLEESVSTGSSSFECCNHNLHQFGRERVREKHWEKEGEEDVVKTEQQQTRDATTSLRLDHLTHQYQSSTSAESMESHIRSCYAQHDAESQTLHETEENKTTGKVKKTTKGSGRGGRSIDRGRQGWSFRFLGRKLKK